MIVLYIIIVIVAIPFVLALFAERLYVIEREITIERPKADVFNYIKLIKNQDYYSKWVMTDPCMRKTFTGVDGTVGFIYAWDSENKQAGKGEQEITNINGQDSMDTEVRFEKPFKGVAHLTLETTAISPNETRVKWRFTGDKNYMMKVMHLLLNLQKVLGRDMQTSLVNLKTILE